MTNIYQSFYLQDGGKNQLGQIWNKITPLSPYVQTTCLVGSSRGRWCLWVWAGENTWDSPAAPARNTSCTTHHTYTHKCINILTYLLTYTLPTATNSQSYTAVDDRLVSVSLSPAGFSTLISGNAGSVKSESLWLLCPRIRGHFGTARSVCLSRGAAG